MGTELARIPPTRAAALIIIFGFSFEIYWFTFFGLKSSLLELDVMMLE